MLLHNRELQNSRLQLLHQHNILQRLGLCSFFPTLLLESFAGSKSFPRRPTFSSLLRPFQRLKRLVLFQCARRWFDEGHKSHLLNLGKYVSAMMAAGAKVAYEKEKTVGWLCLVVIMSSVATVYQLYWDYVKDWGLLQFNSKNPWLRDELVLRHKFVYYFSLVR